MAATTAAASGHGRAARCAESLHTVHSARDNAESLISAFQSQLTTTTLRPLYGC